MLKLALVFSLFLPVTSTAICSIDTGICSIDSGECNIDADICDIVVDGCSYTTKGRCIPGDYIRLLFARGCVSTRGEQILVNTLGSASENQGLYFDADARDLQHQAVCIPSSIELIDYGCFGGCHSLVNVIFERDSKLILIGKRVFSHCSYLSSICIPSSAQSLGYECFYGCLNLKTETFALGFRLMFFGQTLSDNVEILKNRLLQIFHFKS
ncbi:MAG: leucine-rich repeat domain-containing protein [Holosporales bacterium]|jgi:hypothetical protein|nr:leucine-rich repeat domain-containing protein [Holosporales bacterium]